MERSVDQMVQAHLNYIEEHNELSRKCEVGEQIEGYVPIAFDLENITCEQVDRGIEEVRLVETILGLREERDDARTQSYRERAKVEKQEGDIEHFEVKVDQLSGMNDGLRNVNEHLRYRLGEK